jgi:DHA2 family multidrug resistance protein
MAGLNLPDVESASLKQLYVLVMREAEVLTLNTLFHGLSPIFLLSLLLMPWVRKVSATSSEAVGGH